MRVRSGIGVVVGVAIWTHSLGGIIPAQPFFIGLGDIPPDIPNENDVSRAEAVSADGSTVVGRGNAIQIPSLSGGEAFLWTMSGGMVGLGHLPGFEVFSSSNGVSGDGSVVVGGSSSGPAGQAFRWTQSSGIVGLGFLPGAASQHSSANAISADGSVIAGLSRDASGEEVAFRWTESTGMIGLGNLPGGRDYGEAFGVSADGSVIVGAAQSANNGNNIDREAFRWTETTGMVGLGDLDGGVFASLAFDVSADGSIVVGEGTTAAGIEAFRWTEGAGMVGLGHLPGGGFFSSALGISADGSVIVGGSDSATGGEAFVWDEANGMRNLQDVLVNEFGLGASLAGWTLISARGVSADGLTIIGFGTNPSGVTEAWIARLVPEPGALVLSALWLTPLLLLRRR